MTSNQCHVAGDAAQAREQQVEQEGQAGRVESPEKGKNIFKFPNFFKFVADKKSQPNGPSGGEILLQLDETYRPEEPADTQETLQVRIWRREETQ